MKTYNVIIPVWSTVEVNVVANNVDDAKRIALQKAIDEEPLVSWMLDEDAEIIVGE
jgi:hypothetical protein